jgi:peptidoglycan/LPS O-acetylase OafA/YrhL
MEMPASPLRRRAASGPTGATAAAVELPALTALRGIAALAIVIFHANNIAYNLADGAPPVVWRRGYLAVDLFFFLSGFVLTHVYGSRLAGERSWRTVGRFLWARFCRIYPTCLFVTLVYGLAHTAGRLVFPPGVSFKTQLVASLLLMQVPWLHEVWINPPVWSISAELYAYLLFPFVVPFILGLRRPLAMALGLALLIGIASDHLIFTPEQQDWGWDRGWGALIRALPEFAAGVFAYRAYGEGLFRKFWQRDATLLGVTAAILAALFADVSDGATVILLLALLLAAVSNAGRLAGLLNARPLRWLGDISYSLYIFQMVPFMLLATFSGLLVAHGVRGVWFEWLCATLALGSAVLVHRRIDVPARAVLRRLPDRIGARAAARRAARLAGPAAAPEAA